jgi:4'-phosphopantetheinyl transferase
MELRNNEVHLYFSYPEEIRDPELLHQYQSLLNDDERSQMYRMSYERHRHQYLVTRVLIRTCLSAYLQVEPADWRFNKNGYGKPGISHPKSILPIRFNLSHTNGMIMCGITRDCEIGVDVEDAQRTTRAAFDSLSRYFSSREIEDLGKLPPDQQRQRFFDYWTLKESYIKARGMGLAIPLDKFSFQFKANSLDGFSVHPDLNDDASNWQFWRIPMIDRYKIAVAVNSDNRDFRLSAVNSVPMLSNETVPLSFL